MLIFGRSGRELSQSFRIGENLLHRWKSVVVIVATNSQQIIRKVIVLQYSYFLGQFEAVSHIHFPVYALLVCADCVAL